MLRAAIAVLCLLSLGELEPGRRLTRMFYASDLEPIWEQMSESHRAEMGSIANLAKFRRTVADLVGDETEIVSEQVDHVEGQDVYVRRIKYQKSAELFELQWTLDAERRITDFTIRPATPATELQYVTKTRLRLPFDGEWYVSSGGRTPEQNGNHHYDYKSRFDVDFSRALEAFGRPILAPGAGHVAKLRDGIPDNIPGEINLKSEERAGNFVVIDHGNGEYSLLAHLRNCSVNVRVGEKVASGQKVGACGNSGNSNGPHLHYGLRGSPEPDNGMSLPAQFVSYFANGKLVKRGEPVRGQTVRDTRR